MPGEMYRLYHEYKTDEYERSMATVTELDKEMYMECLPYSGGSANVRHCRTYSSGEKLGRRL